MPGYDLIYRLWGAKMIRTLAITVALVLAGVGSTASAQGSEAATLDPFAVDPATITVPSLAFTVTPELAADFDKYYYFHRADTDFPTALRDLLECDGYARGLVTRYGDQSVPYPYAGTVAGALGGAIGNAMAVAIFGSAEKRRLRRINMRNCMFYKGYQRYGLDKEIWEEFNFEEGLDGVTEEVRIGYLRQQARIASGERPNQPALGQ